ncbi:MULTISPECIES: hypothetical protein [Burkholderiaceae]|uniref:Uncharacterized protein n=1 Tax=Caballeronia sordidicola TaxID=196367 RepID=A0A242N412_CABSO|nr:MULTISPECIES: hypothetical protein [Burkholderiaceae]OTP78401.1 hypothetical protein PAMC26577_05110 [Caballeronia sordidicola]
MSRTFGRPDSRGSGPRPARQHPPTSASQTQKKHYGKPAQSKDPAQTASIFKTRAFKVLVDAVGAENVALGLDSNLARIAELVSGERFTPETAFHMETTLGLPDGFFDHPNPTLPPDVIARLRSPLENRPTDSVFDDPVEASPSHKSANHTKHPVLSEAVTAKDVDMPRKTSTAPAPASKKGKAIAPKDAGASAKADQSKGVSRAAKAAQQQSLELASTLSIPEVRQANLHILTARNGSKALLSRMLNLSQSNMAHRLHGKKRLDDVEVKRFTDVLELPAGWLDTPRQTHDVPDHVNELLAPTSRKRKTATPTATSYKPQAAVAKHLVDETSTVPQPQTVSVPDQDVTGNLMENVTTVANAADFLKKPVDAVDGANQNNQPSNTGKDLANEALSLSVASDLAHLRGIPPIAEALLKTIAAKARTGLLNENKALELLQQMILL